MDDIIFVRSKFLAPPQTTVNSKGFPQIRATSRVVPAYTAIPANTIDLASSSSDQSVASKAGPAQSGKDQAQSRLEYVSQFLEQEKKSMVDYIDKLEQALKRKHDGLIIGDDFLHQRIAILKAQNDRQQAFYRTETDVLRQRNTRLESEKAALQGKGPVFDDEVRDLRTVKATLEDRVSVLDNEKRKLTAEVLKLTDEVYEQKQLNEELEAAADSEHHEATFNSEIHTLRQQNAALKSENDKLNNTVSTLNNKIDHSRTEVSILKEDLREQKLSYDEANTTINRLHQQNSTLSVAKTTLQTTISNLDIELQALRAQRPGLTQTLRTHKRRTKEAKAKASATAPPSTSLLKKNKKLERRIETLIASNEALKTAHTSTATQLRASLATKDEQVNTLEARLTATQHQTATLAHQKSGLEHALRERSKQVIQLSRDIEVSLAEKDELQREHDDVVDEKAILERSVQGMYVRYNVLYRLNQKAVKKLVRVAKKGGVEKYMGGRKVDNLRGVALGELKLEGRGEVE